MPHLAKHFPTKGVCIYCGATGTSLGDEHIVPYALGGMTVLEKASCGACAKITSGYERKVARDLWGDARTSFDAPSRRKGQRSEFILMPDVDNPGKKIAVPANEYPAGLVFYKMGLPGFLRGLGEDEDISKYWKWVVVNDDKRTQDFLKKYNSKLAMSFRNIPQEFGQTIAKIGYGQVLTTLDPDDFHPICLPYILGTKTNVSYIVGGGSEDVQPNREIGYFLNTGGIMAADRSKILLIATVRLYANTHAPEYQVIVGEVVGSENIARVEKKFGGFQLSPKNPS